MKTKLIISLIFALFSPLFSQEKGVATIVLGKVFVKKSEKAPLKQISKGESIEVGDIIQTGNGSSLTFTLNQSEFKVLANSTFVVHGFPTKEKEGNVELKSGFAWFKLENLGKSGFKAKTPASTAAVRGTAFAVIYDEKTNLAMNCICHGQVEVTPEKGQATLVSKGEGSSILKDSSKVDKVSYKGEIEKSEALVGFQKKVEENPVLKGCLSCHKPKGWKAKGILKDPTYQK
jgi:hypothetical protein